MEEHEIKKVVDLAVKEAVREALEAIGIDPTKKIDLQKDFAFMRSQREIYSELGRHTLKAGLGAGVLGVLALIWASIRVKM